MRLSKITRVAVCAALLCSVVAFAPAGVAGAGGSSWHWLNPLPRGESLAAVDIAPDNADIAYAVGNIGCIMKSYDGGVNWVLKNSGTTEDLGAVSVVSSSVAYAAGKNGVILKTTDGASFTAQNSTLSDGEITGIFFRSQLLGWACDTNGRLLSTVDGGTTWVVNETFPGVYFKSLTFTSDTVGYAIANGGVYRTTNGGADWGSTHIMGPGGEYLTDIAFLPGNPSIGWITAGNSSSSGTSAYRTDDAGVNWDSTDIGTGYWYTVAIASDGTVWFGGNNVQANRLARFADSASPSPTIMNYTTDYGSSFAIDGLDCSSGTTALAVGGLGTTARTTNSGTTWTQRPTQVDSNLYDVQFLDLRTGYACGTDGTVWKSTNAGVNWAPTNVDAGVALYALYFRDVNTGWAVGQSGRVYKTTNGGADWVLQTSNTTSELLGVHFVDADKGWAVGQSGTIISTTNGGTTWTPSTLGSDYLNDIDFYDTQNGAIVGHGGAVFVTSDGGTWAPAASTGNPNNFYAVDCVGPNAFYVGGNAWFSPAIGYMSMLTTTNDGAAWAMLPTGPSEALATFTYHGSVADIRFVDANNGFVAFSDGYVGKTTNGGQAWEYTRVTDDMFRALSVVNMSAVWGVGAGDRILSNYWYETTKVYRFYNMKNGTHFYTSSYDEKINIIKTWPDIYKYEGVGYEYDELKASQPLYRFYNKVSGSHFYTVSAVEADAVIAKWPHIYTYEGPAYNVSSTPVAGGTVWRFYNVKNGSHFFTASPDERDMVIATWPNVFRYEGEAYYLPL